MKHEPAYLTLYGRLKRDILSGGYSYGARFPSKRVTAEENGVSVVTAQHAYEILCDEGWLEARERSGYFVAYRENDIAPQSSRNAGQELPPTADRGVSGMPFAAYARCLRRVLNECGERLMEKSPNSGCLELRSALSEYLAARRGISVSPAQIVIGSGAEYLYGLIAQMLGDRGEFALEDPGYELIRRVYSGHGVHCDLLKMGHGGISSRELRRTGAAVLHVTPFHSWPSGVTAGASKRNEYVRWARENNAWLVEDDFDSELSVSSKAEDTLFALAPDRVIHLNTFTRTVSPALRVGYMVLPETLVTLYTERAGYLSCSVPVTEQMVLTELLRSGEFTRHVNRVRRQRRKQDD